MDGSTPNIVFLLHPDEVPTSSKDALVWQESVFCTVLNILLNKDGNCVNHAFEWNLNKGISYGTKRTQLNWGYKFVKKAGMLHHTVSDFKPLNSENLEFFRQEMKYDGEESEKIDFNSHTLLDSLTAMVHDFPWEQHCIVSPVKMVRKPRRSRERTKRKFGLALDEENKTRNKQNYVFVVGPLPKSKIDLEQYFQWSLNSNSKVGDALMPSHLKMHFRDKHEIQFHWIDTEGLLKQVPCKANNFGVGIMEKFFLGNSGSLIPISFLTGRSDIPKHFKPETKDCAHNSADESSDSDTVFESEVQPKNTSSSGLNLSGILPNTSTVNYYMSKPYMGAMQSSSVSAKLLLNWSENMTTEVDVALVEITCNKSYGPEYSSQYLQPAECDFSGSDIMTKDKTEDRFCLTVLGSIANSSISLFHVCPAFYVLSNHVDSCESLAKHMECCLMKNRCLVIQRNCRKCCQKSCKFLDHQIGLLQPVLENCWSLNWIRNRELEKIFIKDPNHDYLAPVYDQDVKDVIQQDVNSFNTNLQQTTNPCNRFKPHMLESWYCTASTSRQFLEVVDDIKSSKQTKKLSSKQTKFTDAVMSELNNYYKTESVSEASIKVHETLPEWKPKGIAQKDFNSQEEMLNSVLSEYESFLELDSDQVDQMKFSAHNIIETVHQFAKNLGWADSSTRMSSFFAENIFMTASKLRCKEVSMEKRNTECKLQILLHMEWVKLAFSNFDHVDEDLVEEEAEVVITLLRLISLSRSVEAMKQFLEEVLLESYAKTCGKLLYEVLNDLMLPIPEVLRQHANEKAVDDSFFDPLSNAPSSNLPSAGPFSILSSIGSQSSTDSMLANRQIKPRRASHINPVNRRQIILPDSTKGANNKHARSKTVESAKSRLFSSLQPNVRSEKEAKVHHEKIMTRSSSKKKDENQNNVTKDVGRVRRDLFASPSKSSRKRSRTEGRILKAPDRKPVNEQQPKNARKSSVMDTPIAKQRMTALARQRIRMRRSQEEYKKEGSGTIVEESPMKQDEEVVDVFKKEPMDTKLKRSPRHSIMLTRRHSFYRDDASGRSRTITRAKIVQQHKEAAPPTPQLLRSSSLNSAPSSAPSGEGEPLISPKSLLFSHAPTSKQSNAPGAIRSRRRLQLVSAVLPSNNPRSSAKPILEKEPTVPETTAEEPSPASVALSGGSVTSADTAMEEVLCCVTPTKFEASLVPASPTTPVLLPFDAYKERNSCEKEDIAPPPVPTDVSRELRSPSKSKPITETPVKVTPRRSPRLLSKDTIAPPELSTPPDILRPIGPLDNYVIRTPTASKRQRRTTPTPTSQRKPSPNGDHIQRWPRRKRILSGLSPQERPKRLKCDHNVVTPTFLQEDGVSPLPTVRDPSSMNESPDLGFYIVSSGDNSQQQIRKMALPEDRVSPGIEVSQFLRHKLLDPTFSSPVKNRNLGVPPGRVSSATLFQARVGSPSSSRHIQMVLLPDEP